MTDNALSFLGICKKAGYLESGEERTGAAVKKGRAVLILTASDAAGNAIKKAGLYAEKTGTQSFSLPYTKDELGDMLGKRVCAVLAITNKKMAASFMSKLAERYEDYSGIYESFFRKHAGSLTESKQKGGTF